MTPRQWTCSSAATISARAPRSTPPRSPSWSARSWPADRDALRGAHRGRREPGGIVGVRRTSPDGVLFTTYNTYDLFLDDSAAGRDRYGVIVSTIRGIGPDVLAVQEVRADDAETARGRLRQLAAD